MTEISLLFIYGTLLPAFDNQMSRWLKYNTEPITEGYMPGMLFNVSDYPGAIYLPSGVTKVYGLVIKMENTEEILKKLDEYEEVNHRHPEAGEYIRRAVTIYGFDGLKRQCWVYLFNRDVSNLEYIKSGDYYTFYHCNI